MKRILIISSPAILLFIVGMLILVKFSFSPCEKNIFKIIQIDSNRSVRLSADGCWERAQGIYFEIISNNNVPLTRLHYIGGTAENTKNLEFELITSPQKDFIALTEKSFSNVILMFYDFSDNEYWPGGFQKDCSELKRDFTWNEHYKNVNKVLDKLRAYYPHRNLVLSHQDSSNRKL